MKLGDLLNPLKYLEEMFASGDEWKEICQLQYAGDMPAGPDRDAAFARMADLLETHADRMERSRLVGWLASAFTPDQLRVEAAVWRSGRDPHEGERDG